MEIPPFEDGSSHPINAGNLGFEIGRKDGPRHGLAATRHVSRKCRRVCEVIMGASDCLGCLQFVRLTGQRLLPNRSAMAQPRALPTSM